LGTVVPQLFPNLFPNCFKYADVLSHCILVSMIICKDKAHD
jgi:hypothetical protein